MKSNIKAFSLALTVLSSTSAIASSQCETYLSFDHNGHRMTEGRLFPSLVAKNVLVCVNKSNVHSSWEKALKDNVELLNGYLSITNTKLHYKYIGYVEDWDIDDRCKYGVKVSGDYNMPEETLAKASYSYSPGNNVMFVNSNNDNSGANEKGSALMHELLHVVGLRHTGTLEGKEIANTDGWADTRYAGRSLMCEVLDQRDPDYPQRYLNFLDKRAIETLYPK